MTENNGIMLADLAIRARNSLLDLLAGAGTDQVLNPALNDPEPVSGPTLVAELRRALNAIKASALDEEGAHVNYAKARSSKAYQEFRRVCSPQLRSFDPAKLASRQEQLAFWINLYNTLVLDAVIAFEVEESVTEGLLGILTFFRRAAYNLCGQRICLDDIEQGLLRANRGHPKLPGVQLPSDDPRLAWVVDNHKGNLPEPRIHFALNCASRSCPPIQVYSAEQIDAQMNLAARNFVHANTELDRGSKVLSLSAIFDWYQADFNGRQGVIDFICDHLPAQDERCAWIEDHQDDLRIEYAPYDWRLNTW